MSGHRETSKQVRVCKKDQRANYECSISNEAMDNGAMEHQHMVASGRRARGAAAVAAAARRRRAVSARAA